MGRLSPITEAEVVPLHGANGPGLDEIGLAAWIVLRSKRQCPTDSELALLCNKMQRQNLHLLIVSATIGGLGFLSAYLLVPLSRLLE